AASGSGDSGGRTGWPAPQEAAGASTSTVEDASSSPAAGSGARVLYGDAGLTTATPSEAALRPAETEPADTTAAASAGAAGSGMAGTMGLDSGMGTSGGGGTDAGTVGGLETGLGGSHMGTGETDAGTGFGTVETDAGTSAGDAGSGLGTTGVGAGTTDTTAGTGGGGAVTERAASADDPQEQPFERDGRWWFRRGDELLVYEEQTGQWVAADEPSSSGSVSTEASAPAETQAEPAPSEGQVTTQQEAVGTFWKCPSCGAVNGSTATSCRMCFTARP
ncbi:MAG TPA: Ran-binding zinc finger domain-containing protein, partial [Actinomycetota bacterium]|nr:Ran-binding zinc finger domain-containing protein [Actinomycetota bacterium]